MDCNNCGHTLPTGARFCGRCGTNAVPSAPAAPPPGGGEAALARYEYAPIVLRAIAWVIDLIAMTVIALGPVFLSVWAMVAWVSASSTPGDGEGAGWAALVFFALGILFFAIPVLLLYQLITTAMGGGLGKRLVGLRIVRVSDGHAPGFGTAFVRVIVPAACGVAAAPFTGLVPEAVGGSVAWLALAVNYGWALFDPDRQALHDKAAGTIVIHAR
jgi:uncharacterized RDD family membrane protein YckC